MKDIFLVPSVSERPKDGSNSTVYATQGPSEKPIQRWTCSPTDEHLTVVEAVQANETLLREDFLPVSWPETSDDAVVPL